MSQHYSYVTESFYKTDIYLWIEIIKVEILI